MRKIIVTEYLTLDGVFEEPGHFSLSRVGVTFLHGVRKREPG